MLLSVFTPTNNPEYLLEAYYSLKVQRYRDWEWVIVPNGCMPSKIPFEIERDPRVRLVEGITSPNIGALKRFACDACKGSAFVEFDHDDVLVPGALQHIADKIIDGAGFVFSDDACFTDKTLKAHVYGKAYGWVDYPINVYGRKFRASKTFDVSPRSLCEVYYAPDHVRVWGRKAYYDAGGHDPNLSVGDDHDLVCRTYLTGTKFSHTGHCDYLYRFHQENTVKKRNQKIQEQTALNRRKYTRDIVYEWARREDLPILRMADLAKDGWDAERDLYSGLPALDDSVGVVVADDWLPYCPQDLVTQFYNMAYQALVPGGYLLIRVPSTEGRSAHENPDYRSYHNINSFDYYSHRNWANRVDDVQCRFQLIQAYNEYPEDDKEKGEHGNLHEKREMLYAIAELCALKDQRQPAPIRI